MNIKEKMIELKNSVIDSILNILEPTKKLSEPAPGGHIDISSLSPQEREKAFIKFAEGDKDLYTLLTTAFDNGIESLFSCCGHSDNDFGYVVFKVDDNNLEKIQQLGKVLSHEGVVTNFEEHHEFGKRVSFHSGRAKDRSWFAKAAETIKNPPQYDVEPTIFYHEEMFSSYQPLSTKMKDRVINILKQLRSQNPISVVDTKEKNNTKKLAEKLREEHPIKNTTENIKASSECKVNETSIEDSGR